MRVVERFLNGGLLLKAACYADDRGEFTVHFHAEQANDIGLSTRFVQDNQSTSHRGGTIRGMHLQLPPHDQGKLIRVVSGRIMDVVVDLRPGSDTFGDHRMIELDATSGYQVWAPRGFGHGFCTLEDNTTVFYKVDRPYHPASERTLAWDDPQLAVDWPVTGTAPVLSDKDADGLAFDEVVAAIDESVGVRS